MNIDIVNKAYKLAKTVHSGQKDKGGVDYFTGHILTVFNLVGGFKAKSTEIAVVALLHDSVEDTELTIQEIRAEFGNEIADAIKSITKPKITSSSDSTYLEYLSEVKSNKIARIVKLADLQHNMNISRIPTPSAKDSLRLDKYKMAVEFLKKEI